MIIFLEIKTITYWIDLVTYTMDSTGFDNFFSLIVQ
jgi:hypothetical protein